jgi:hypothetical protein
VKRKVTRAGGGPRRLVLGLLLVAALGGAAAWLAGEPPDPPTSPGAFDAERAFPGSPASQRARELIAERLLQAGWPVETKRFTARTPQGEDLELANLIARLPGRRPERILLGTHYDTKRIPGVRFVGANDGASGVAVLLEAARQLVSEPLSLGIGLLFFDGEEAVGRNITREDGLYGSRALAAELERSGELPRVRALILVDMVGDADLNLVIDAGSSPRLRALLREEADRLGLAGLLDRRVTAVVDDHTPFAERGVEVLALIDFQFGARRTPGPLWHTAGDDLRAVSAESLNRVGTLLVQLVHRLQRDG